MSRLPFRPSNPTSDRGGESEQPAFTRRDLLRGGSGLTGALVLSGYLGPRSFGSGPGQQPSGETIRTSFDPDELTAEPMQTTLQRIDGTTVLFQYQRPVPSFDTWQGNALPRDHRSLDGSWRFRFDPENVGVDEGWHSPETDESDWQTVEVPLPWDLYDTPGFGSYDGRWYGSGTAFRDGYGWYRRRFVADEGWGDRIVRVHFLGVNYLAWVFLDGRLVGLHEGGHSPFALDLTDQIEPGEEHLLAVRVFRRPSWRSYRSLDPRPVTDVDSVPSGPVDYWPYAGLTRDVYLEVTPPVTVAKLLVDGSDGTLSARAVVENRHTEPVRRMVTVDPGQETGGTPRSRSIDLEPESVRVARFEIPIPDADPWSPARPNRYRATVTLSAAEDPSMAGTDDKLGTYYGVRTVETRDGHIRLNGDPRFLKGVNWHEESPSRGRSLRPVDYDDILARLEDLNGNFLRNSHYTRHPYLYRAADSAGVLLLDEAENVWLDAPEQRVQATRYGLSRALCATMAWNQHNHPSVGLWSLQNESDPFNSTYTEWLADMRTAVEAIDLQERPITWASKTPLDPAFGTADVIGLNEYYGYFSGTDADLGRVLDNIHRLHPDTPVLITENGSWSAPELRGPPANDPSTRGTPEWQARSFRRHWDQVVAPSRRSFMAGYTYWNLADYKERLDYNRFTYNGLSTMGLLSFDGQDETQVYDAFRRASHPRL